MKDRGRPPAQSLLTGPRSPTSSELALPSGALTGGAARVRRRDLPGRRVTVAEIGSPKTTARTEAWQPAPRALPVVRLERPRVLDDYWDAVAQCEAAGDWNARGEFAGGLGIDAVSWQEFGGDEFAPGAAEASREQQIAIANRISTAVGFGGFRCAAIDGEPRLVEHEPSSIAVQTFTFGQSGPVVRDLQIILGAPVDGVYGSETWLAHLQYLRKNGLSPALAPR